MKIEKGLFDNMVLQRNVRNVCEAEFYGTSEGAGTILATISRDGRLIKGFQKIAVGRVRSGKCKGRISGLPAGGPYTVLLTVQNRRGEASDKLVVKNVLVGDVWVAAGQSNMQGCGYLKDAPKPHPMVRAFYMDDRWAVAKEPIHNLWECVDDVHVDLGVVRGQSPYPFTGTGPAVAFAQEMHKRTGVPQGVIACAHGGTSMAQWDPALKTMKGKSLYGAMLRRVDKNGGKIAGIIWYQGESDAAEGVVSLYTERMIKLIRSCRRDLKNPKLPFVAVQLGRFVGVGFCAAHWNSIQDQQYRLLKRLKKIAVVPAIDLSLDDTIHIAGRDQIRLGARLAYAMDSLIRGKKSGRPPIQFKKIETRPIPPNNYTEIRVSFDNVAGSFRTPGNARPSGFAIGDPVPDSFIYDASVSRDTVILRTNMFCGGIEGKFLYHGYGTDPYCNITDEADRPIPVFGPVRLGDYRALTPMFTKWNVSFPAEIPTGVDAKLNNLQYPDFSALTWQEMVFPGRFCDMHEQTAQYRPKDFIIWFSSRVVMSEPMKLAACIGYDGPVKLWVDGKEIFHDPEGVNPAWEDRAKVKFSADAGEHQILLALGSNQCRAWGIFFRLERLDVPLKLRKLEVPPYPMPELK